MSYVSFGGLCSIAEKNLFSLICPIFIWFGAMRNIAKLKGNKLAAVLRHS
jgi:hypothetical protein